MGISSTNGFYEAPVPIGTVLPYAATSVPANWLLCAGQAVSRTAYADLFTLIGTTYGSGDGSTTFNLPDLRGRTIAGKDDMNGSAANRITAAIAGFSGTGLGNAGGDQNLHAHGHTQNAHNHTQDAHAHTQNAHQHALNVARTVANAYLDTGNYWAGGTSINNEGYAHTSFVNGWTDYRGYLTSEAPGINGTTATNQATTATNNSTGAGNSQNIQPTMILNFIIRVVN